MSIYKTEIPLGHADDDPCKRCDGRGFHNKPNAKWWEFFYYKWCMVRCAACGGVGYNLSPRPAPPQPSRPVPPRVATIIEGMAGPIDPMTLPLGTESPAPSSERNEMTDHSRPRHLPHKQVNV